MQDDLVRVYEAGNFSEAEMIHQALVDEGVEAYVNPTASPLDGLQAMNEGPHVYVRQQDVTRAGKIIAAYLEQASDVDDSPASEKS